MFVHPVIDPDAGDPDTDFSAPSLNILGFSNFLINVWKTYKLMKVEWGESGVPPLSS